MRLPLFLLYFALSLQISAKEFPDAFFANYCFDCHDDVTQKAEIRLDDAIDRDWSNPESLRFFETVKKVIEAGEMPPPKKNNQPRENERQEVVQWLHESLMEHSNVGGTVLRRLNRIEYETTIRHLFPIKDFKVPPGFPPDQSFHGFDNVGEGLVLSAPLLEAYQEAAISVADRYFPPRPKTVEPSTMKIHPEDMVISYSSGQIVDGAMRLASKSSPTMRSCSWPSKFEAFGSGTYTVSLNLSARGCSNSNPAKFHLLAKKVSDADGVAVESLRKLAEIDVVSETPCQFVHEVDIYAGETIIFYWANAPLDSDNNDKSELELYLKKRFSDDPKLMAAWMAIEHSNGIRGGLGWERVKEKLKSPELDLSEADVNSAQGEKLIRKMTGNPVLYVETLSYDLFENGPNVGIHEVTVSGPHKWVEDNETRLSRLRRESFLAPGAGLSGEPAAVAVMNYFLSKCFRRPAGEEMVLPYVQMIMDHAAEPGRTLDDGYHLAIRTALTSPEFLYRETRPGELDNFDLLARLSYFLTSGPRSKFFAAAAMKGQLTDLKVLEKQTRSALRSSSVKPFIEHFTGQWLGTRELSDIMPDERLLNYNSADRKAMTDEAEMLFEEILKNNLPLETFIKPGFTYMNQPLASKFYDMKKAVKGKAMKKIPLPDDSPFGGVLGMATVMMSTANGVDTQPVERGVWVLENILGDPPPPPPENVPAITPDTRGTKTVRDLLDAHRSDESCARCHRKIDPIGYVLENFDPVGRWRTHYPDYSNGKAQQGIKIDTSGKFPGADAEFSHVNDLKDHVVKNIDQFATCLGEKILTYATGRKLTYADKNELHEIVHHTITNELGFQDFVVALVKSKTFRTK
ncbi:MAG: DUF1588 domain-containing protein [Verrucomicrobiales bacterium]|nr:DUF1588 domain-containing protein [Verrucomicrobiales bacterium]